MAQHEIELHFMDIDWWITYYSDTEEVRIESIFVGSSNFDLMDHLDDYFIERLENALLVKLERIACEKRAEEAYSLMEKTK